MTQGRTPFPIPDIRLTGICYIAQEPVTVPKFEEVLRFIDGDATPDQLYIQRHARAAKSRNFLRAIPIEEARPGRPSLQYEITPEGERMYLGAFALREVTEDFHGQLLYGYYHDLERVEQEGSKLGGLLAVRGVQTRLNQLID